MTKREQTAAWKKRNANRVRELNRASYARRFAKSPKAFRGYNNAFAAKRRALMATLKGKPCADCDVTYPYYVMQFDHRDPSLKLFEVGRKRLCAMPALLAEIEKCDVVCANCHAERTHRRRAIA